MKRMIARSVLLGTIVILAFSIRGYSQTGDSLNRNGPRTNKQDQANSKEDMQGELQEKLDKTNELYDRIGTKIQHAKDPDEKADLTDIQTQLGAFRNDLNNYMSSTGSKPGADPDHVRDHLRSEFQNIKSSMDNYKNKYGQGKGGGGGKKQNNGQQKPNKRENGGVQVPPNR